MLFTLELLPILLDTAASSGDVRIVFVSSAAHVYADPFNADQLNKTEEQAGRLKMYSNSKLYNVGGWHYFNDLQLMACSRIEYCSCLSVCTRLECTIL